MNILILGGNGFIGSETVAACLRRGHAVRALGRNIDNSAARMPDAEWIRKDISTLVTPENWLPLLTDTEVVINCAGALQDGARDDVKALQFTAMAALYEAASQRGGIRFVQVSANTMEGLDAGNSDFLASKGKADAALAASGNPYTILRPGLVVGRNAHGGTAMMRAIASIPRILPVIFADKPCQTADMEDLVHYIADAAEGQHGGDTDFAVASSRVPNFRQASIQIRRWLGIHYETIITPGSAFAMMLAKTADLSGLLGWRSPMRSTALGVLAHGVTVDSEKPLLETRPLEETLSRNPAGVQDLWQARLYLVKPLIIITLSGFWLVSGMLALLNLSGAIRYFEPTGLGHQSAVVMVVATALLDCLLGALVLIRRHARLAMLGMILLSLFYLAGSLVFLPALWLDPIGPMVKVIPSIVLTLVGLAILDER
jgi:uncharacterized protein YbjT (DUF2867 family)